MPILDPTMTGAPFDASAAELYRRMAAGLPLTGDTANAPGFPVSSAPGAAPGILNGGDVPLPPLPPPTDVAQLPVTPATPAPAPMPVAAPSAPAGPVPDTSLLGRLGAVADRVGQSINDHPMTLLALGSGLAGAPSLGIGMGRAFQAAGPAMQTDIAQQRQNMTIAALMKRGLPQDAAMAAASNPAVMQQLLPQLFGVKQRTFTQIGEDMYGNKQFGFVDPVSAKVYDLSGREITPSGTAGAPGAPMSSGGPMAVDETKRGLDYLGQYPPNFQADVKNYMAGLQMPTGNPRKGYVQEIKSVAARVGNDIGEPADDTTFNARSQMRRQLSNATPNSLGGQINVGNTAIGHLADLSQKALDLGNKDLGLPWLSHAVNDFRGGISTDQSAKLEALKAAAQHYGQEVTKFYAGSPGGEAERERFLSAVDGAKAPQELAGVISTEAELMHSRLTALNSQIRGTLGEQGVNQYPVIRLESQKALETIDTNVGRLRRGASAGPASAMPGPTAPVAPAAPATAQPPAPAPVVKPGRYIWTPDRGMVAVQ